MLGDAQRRQQITLAFQRKAQAIQHPDVVRGDLGGFLKRFDRAGVIIQAPPNVAELRPEMGLQVQVTDVVAVEAQSVGILPQHMAAPLVNAAGGSVSV